MRRLTLALPVLVGLAAATPSGPSHAEPPMVAPCEAKILKAYPNGTWLENLVQDRAGRLLFSIMSDKKIDAYVPGKGVIHVADLPIHPMGLAITRGRLIVAGNRLPMSAGTPRLQTNAIVELSLAGKIERVISVPQAKMFNGVVKLRDGSVLIADSLGGAIFRFDPRTGEVKRWLSDPLLAPPRDARPGSVGVNGLKLWRGQLLISNTGRGEILTIPLDASGRSIGALSTLHKIGIVDDFDVAADGTIFAAPYKNDVIRVSPSGVVDVVVPEGAEGATAVSLIGRKAKPEAFYVLTTGNLLFGGKEQAKLLLAAVPGPSGCPAPAGH